MIKFMRFYCTLIILSASLSAQQAGSPGGITVPVPLVTPVATNIDPNKVVLQVGDIKITAQQLDSLIDVYPANTQVYLRSTGKQQFADNVVRMLVLAEEGRRLKLNEAEKFKTQIRFSESNLLASTMTEKITTDLKIDDAVLHKYYDDHACDYQTWHARQIVIRFAGSPVALKAGDKDLSEEEALTKALDIRKRLESGDFAEVARAESDDPPSAANGGDVGTVRHGLFVPVLEERLCKMNPSEISEPVKSRFGYHVLKLESKEVKTWEEVKPELEQRLRPEASKKAIDDLIGKVKVVKDPEYYAPDTPKDLVPAEPKKQ
jgi:peptidyl-prolyl cis-trans isomerase C